MLDGWRLGLFIPLINLSQLQAPCSTQDSRLLWMGGHHKIRQQRCLLLQGKNPGWSSVTTSFKGEQVMISVRYGKEIEIVWRALGVPPRSSVLGKLLVCFQVKYLLYSWINLKPPAPEQWKLRPRQSGTGKELTSWKQADLGSKARLVPSQAQHLPKAMHLGDHFWSLPVLMRIEGTSLRRYHHAVIESGIQESSGLYSSPVFYLQKITHCRIFSCRKYLLKNYHELSVSRNY